MKNISLVLFVTIFLFSSILKAQDTEILSTVSLVVINMEDVPSEGDKLYFVSETTDKVYTTVSGEEGKCKIVLPNGQTYQIKIKSFDKASNYTAVEIADTDYPMDLGLKIMYELPKTYTLEDVQFATGSSKLKSSSFKSLDELAELMILKKSLKIELAGHTDNVGNDASNLTLSSNRAKSVRQYLIKKGVPAKRLTSKGYGDSSPTATNDTKEGRQENRRTEVRIIK